LDLVLVTQEQGRIPMTVLHLQGRVNLGNTAELEQAAREAFDAGERDMVIDLSKAPSLTSVGIRAILTIHRMLTKAGMDKGKQLKLVSPTPYMREVLEVAGLLEYIEINPTLNEAMASF
jgi:anti-sigma B factor antagonist